jgi:hypothetical protein
MLELRASTNGEVANDTARFFGAGRRALRTVLLLAVPRDDPGREVDLADERVLLRD